MARPGLTLHGHDNYVILLEIYGFANKPMAYCVDEDFID